MALLPDLHWRVLNVGTIGVPIFFALSGFLLYRPYARAALNRSRPPSTRAFLTRRALRVLPAYWVMLPVAMIFFNRDKIADLGLWAQMVTLTYKYDFNPPWPPGSIGLPSLGPIWSLTVEAAFYVLLPFLAAGLARISRGEPRRLLWAIGALFAASVVWTIGVRCIEYVGPVLGVDPFRILFYNEHLLPRSFQYFALGMAMAVLAERPTRLTDAVGAAPGVAWVVGLCGLALASTPLSTPLDGPQTPTQYLVYMVLSVVVTAAVVGPVAFAPDQPLTRALLGNPLMRGLGLVSYGVFLWHSVVIDAWYALTGRDLYRFDFWLVLSVTALFSLILATLSYTFVERPAQRLGRRGQGSRAASAASSAR